MKILSATYSSTPLAVSTATVCSSTKRPNPSTIVTLGAELTF